MATFNLNNINEPTPSKWVKLGAALTATGLSISGYAYTQNTPIVMYIGLGLIASGAFITAFTA